MFFICSFLLCLSFFFFFNDTATTEIYTLSLHDALPLYLAAAGVGRLGIVDADVVDESNLQRQIVHSTERLGEAKVESAKRTIEALNPDVEVVAYEERLTSENVERILADGWDVIVDGADNFPTRYLVNDA